MVIGVKLVDGRRNLIERRASLNDPLKSLPHGIKIVYFTVDHLLILVYDLRRLFRQIPRDLKLDHLVKVISPEGKVLQGRVRYVGPVPSREETHVGVELPYLNGSSDGTFHGRRFFDW